MHLLGRIQNPALYVGVHIAAGAAAVAAAGVAVVLEALCDGVKYGNRCAEENGRENERDRDYQPNPQLLALRAGFLHKIPNLRAPIVHSTTRAKRAGSVKVSKVKRQAREVAG